MGILSVLLPCCCAVSDGHTECSVTVLLCSLRWAYWVFCYHVVVQFQMDILNILLPCCCVVYNFVHNNLFVSTSASYMRGYKFDSCLHDGLTWVTVVIISRTLKAVLNHSLCIQHSQFWFLSWLFDLCCGVTLSVLQRPVVKCLFVPE